MTIKLSEETFAKLDQLHHKVRFIYELCVVGGNLSPHIKAEQLSAIFGDIAGNLEQIISESQQGDE